MTTPMIRALDARSRRLMEAAVQLPAPRVALKELLDNAVDAGARAVTARLAAGGLDELCVQDDGGGVAPEALPLLGRAHASSKPRSQERLGFRGGALFALAAVSDLKIQTRMKDELVGRELDAATGAVRRCSCAAGTRVECRALFAGLQARRRHFAARAAAEARALRRFVCHYQLAFSGVRFCVVLNGQPVLNTQNCPAEVLGDLALLYQRIFGARGAMLRVRRETPEARLDAFLSAATGGVAQGGDEALFFVVNGRPATAQPLADAVRAAFRERASGRRPVGCVRLELGAGAVDFNVSVDKTEAALRRPRAVAGFLEAAYREELARDVFSGLGVQPQGQERPPAAVEPPTRVSATVSAGA